MIYIIFLILLNLLFFISYQHRRYVIKYNKEIREESKKWDEFDVGELKKVYPVMSREVMIWLNIIGLFLIFIVGRFTLCGHSIIEYKNQEVIFTSDYIQSDGTQYLLYIDNKLEYIPILSVNIIVNTDITNPYFKDYYSRSIKEAIPYHNLFFMFNRKIDKVTEWDVDCRCSNYILVLDKQYDIKNITE